VVFERTESDKPKQFAVLIEDKINAPLQPEQIERYRSRAKDACKDGQYEGCHVVLCAPKDYGKIHPESQKFDAFVSYEEIADYLMTRSDGNLRDRYRADFLNQKTPLPRLSPVKQIPDPDANAFWNTVYKMATSDFRELEMKEPKVAKGRTWASFRSQRMPPGVSVGLMVEKGFVDLTFANVLSRNFQTQIVSLLEDGMEVHQKGLATVIRLHVEILKIPDVGQGTKAKIRTALAACVRMIRFYQAHQEEMDRTANKSPLNP
jgi:hypothetical protein